LKKTSSSQRAQTFTFVLFSFWLGARSLHSQSLPNFVIIFADDMGYADISPFGAKTRTPNLARMASEGVRFTDFYVAQPVCSASRAALLTGCYPNRIGILGALNPASKEGIHSNELTIAEVLKTRGYATAIYGKWHLGYQPQFLPTRHGFDEYFGLPYSNDMWPKHPAPTQAYPPLPLIEDERTIATDPDQRQLTTWYTQRAVKFIEAHRNRPFFLYVPHSMPHVPLFVSNKQLRHAKHGLYGDVIQELDWSVGEILKSLKKNGLDERTLVIFTSDNGPWLLYGDHAGSAGPLREGKATTFEGGVRVPCIMRWPTQIPSNRVVRELAATIDILPTLAALAGAGLPADRPIDGKDIWPLVKLQAGAKTPHEAYYFYWGGHLQAVRSGPWKLHFPHSYPKPEPAGSNARPGKYTTREIGLELFNLDQDIGETTNLATQHPEVVQRLQALAEVSRVDLGDSALKRVGKNVRSAGKITD
jgi:arylsulfatase A-like enzyme